MCDPAKPQNGKTIMEIEEIVFADKINGKFHICFSQLLQFGSVCLSMYLLLTYTSTAVSVNRSITISLRQVKTQMN